MLVLFCFSFIFVSFGESRLLVSWCAGAVWRAVMRIVAGVGDLVLRIGVGRTGRILGGQACEICTVHMDMRSAGFLVEPQNQGRRFVSGLTSKLLGRFLIGLGLKTDGDGL
jgi:hypothetical protein